MIDRIKHFLRMQYLYAQSRIINCLRGKPIVKSDFFTLEKIINERCSIARFGDGEIALINNCDIKFQKSSEELSEKLRMVLKSNQPDLLIGIPNIFTISSMRPLTFESKLFWQHELIDNRDVWYSIPKKKVYYDACVTRPYIRYKSKEHSKLIFQGLKKIWNDKDIIIVEGVYSRLGVGNDLFSNAKSIRRILGPEKDAFEKMPQLLNAIIKEKKDKLIILSLGPTATILAYELHNLGYQAIDLGHIDLEYEWFLKGVKQRIAIENKMVNELDNQENLDNVNDQKYENEIIAKIV